MTKEVWRLAFQEDEFFGSLYKDNYDLMIKISFRLTGDIELAQDLTQETFALALFNMRKLRGHENPAGWLVITLRNMINNERRRSTFRRHISLEELPIEPGTYDDTSIEELLPGKLSDEDKEILRLRFEKRLDYKEIAALLGITESGCRSRLSRALAHCRRLIK